MEEENTEETQGNIIPPFLIKQEINKLPRLNPSTSVQKSLHVFRRSRRRCREAAATGGGGGGGELMKKKIKEMDVKENEEEEEEEEEDDREEVERKINALQRIVPNGESFTVDKLFDETAGYIMALQSQLKALKTLTTFFDKLEKDKTKLGG